MVSRRAVLAGAGVVLATGYLGSGSLAAMSGLVGRGSGGPSTVAVAEIPPALLELFVRHGTEAVPWNLLAAVAWQESRFDAQAVSPAGAGGVMQLMPGTAVGLGITVEARFDPAQAIPAAAAYLQQLKARFGSDELMLAAYNAGPGNVAAHGGIPPFAETQAYVPAVLAKASAYLAAVPFGASGSASVAQVESLRGRLADGAPLEIYPAGVADLPHMDPRVLGLIVAITERYGGVYVSSLKTGHHRYINGTCERGQCRQSRHWTYQACDLWKVGGQVVAAGNPVPHDCWVWLKHLAVEHGRPDVVGSPWGRGSAGGGSVAGHFTDGDHKDHFHLDFR